MTGTSGGGGTGVVAGDSIKDIYPQVVLIADRRNVNKGLKIAGPNYLSRTFGPPRANLSAASRANRSKTAAMSACT